MREINGRFKIGHKKIGGFGIDSRHSESSLIKICVSLRNNRRRWKGDLASYQAKHMWIINHYGHADRCENKECTFKEPKRFEWANVSGKLKRNRDDYLMLCCSCHRKWDMGKIEICAI